MQGTYNLYMVAVSYIIAAAASYTALELARRVSKSSGVGAATWLIGGAFSMGLGIWTMHFVGMLAFSMPMAFSYDIGITLLSLLVGMAASAFAIFIASRKQQGFRKIVISGLLLGGGIAAMHYTGMAAMEMDATITYDRTLLILSIVIAVVAACAAIWIIFTLTQFSGGHVIILKVSAALIMGVAICGMHYTGMAAAIYTPLHTTMSATAPTDSTWLAIVVTAVALIVLAITNLTIFFDFRLGVEREHAEQSDQAAVRLSDVLDNSSNEIYMFDAESLRFTYINRGAETNSGYSSDELCKMTPIDLKPYFDIDSFNDMLMPLRHHEKNELLFETRHRRKDQSEYDVQIHLQMSEMIEPPVFVAIITDVTNRKNLETELAQARKMESIGQLAAGIAHEINTPAQYVGDNTRFVKDAFAGLLGLNGDFMRLLGAAQQDSITPELVSEIESSIDDADLDYLAEEVPKAIEQTLDGIGRISNIVGAMKAFSHPGSKDRENTDLNRAIENTIMVASNEWKYVANMKTELDENLPMVPCFAQEINQVVLNLIVNAAHGIKSANGEQSAGKGLITVTTCATDEYAEIAISDNGCGIPDDIKERIFDPFFTTKDVGEGTGQGLSMAFKVVVDQHQGRLSVDSTAGAGATFTIRLPLMGDDPATEEVAA